MRFDLAFLEALQRYAPDLEPALAADLAASLASPRGKLNMFEYLSSDVGCVRIGFQGLRERGKYLQKLYRTEIGALSAKDADWIDVSARRLMTLCRAVANCSSEPARQAADAMIVASEFAALAVMGWYPTLMSIAQRIEAASVISTAAVAVEAEHLAAISEGFSAPKFNSPPIPATSTVAFEQVSEPSADTEMNLGLLRGIKRIAQYLELPDKQVERLHLSGELPTFKIRSRICARKVTLDRWVLEQERAGLDAREGR